MNSATMSSVSAHCDELIEIFNREFSSIYNTRLLKGGKEPIYLPADNETEYHRIIFTEDYFASALHEVAHWCIAGNDRRRQVDYGYWYAADGRTAVQQREFEQVEIKPQALEWIFSVACGYNFRVSADNLQAGLSPSQAFKQSIYCQVVKYCQKGLSGRASIFAHALATFYQTGDPLEECRFQIVSI